MQPITLTFKAAAYVAAEATASLRAFGRLGFTAKESLLQRSDVIRQADRARHASLHQFALRAMGAAVRDAAATESNNERRQLLNATADALETLSGLGRLLPPSLT
jgi:hypothetical protein